MVDGEQVPGTKKVCTNATYCNKPLIIDTVTGHVACSGYKNGGIVFNKVLLTVIVIFYTIGFIYL